MGEKWSSKLNGVEVSSINTKYVGNGNLEVFTAALLGNVRYNTKDNLGDTIFSETADSVKIAPNGEIDHYRYRVVSDAEIRLLEEIYELIKKNKGIGTKGDTGPQGPPGPPGPQGPAGSAGPGSNVDLSGYIKKISGSSGGTVISTSGDVRMFVQGSTPSGGGNGSIWFKTS